jgi:hypothetical protein
MSIHDERRRLHKDDAIIREEFEIIEELQRENQRLVRTNEELARIVELLVKEKTPQPHAHYRLILTTIINKSKYQVMNTTFAENQQQAFAFGLEDTTDPSKSPTGTYSNGSVASDDETVATGNVDGNGQVNFVAAGPGTTKLKASALVSFTDSLGNPQTQQLTTEPIDVTVTAVVTADGVKLVLIPGAITAK